jgi:hypothetical protein
MEPVIVRPIRNPLERRIFLTFPWRIYKDDPLWVPPLLPERARTIDPRRGAFFLRGEAEFFIAWRGSKPVGTICAAEDRPTNAQRGTLECMWGFFECIDDDQVAFALFEQVKKWALQRDLNALFGPFNLDYEDSYGILLEGRNRPPVMLCGHTPPYYQGLVERYGFEPARGANLAFAVDIREDTPALQRMHQIAERARARGRATIRSADLSRWDEEVEHVLMLMNTCLAHLPDFIPWQRSALEKLLEPFRSLADPELILFVEVDGKTVGFFPGLGDVNEWLKHAKGLRYPWNYISLWWYSRRQPQCLSIKSILLLPEYWGGSAAVLMFDEMLHRIRKRGFQWVDLSLTSDDNPKTPILAERLGGEIYKKYMVYRLAI